MNSLDLENFRITSVSLPIRPASAPPVPNPLGPLADLPGTWKGTGFNQIWRPFHGSQDRFLELNETAEVLQFVEIPGDIPNRGLLQADIELHGRIYKRSTMSMYFRTENEGIHIEPGIWINIPATDNPQDTATVTRLRNIPQGTALVAQGSAKTD